MKGKTRMRYSFESENHYKTIQILFDSRKNFIVLGLCGKNCSGVTTIANILQQSFDELNLPLPGSDIQTDIDEHEYRILYTYARKHWRPFYRIKSSALITAYIFNGTEKEFKSLLKKWIPDLEKNQHSQSELGKIVKQFFDGQMIYSLNSEFDLNLNQIDDKTIAEWFSEDKVPQVKGKDYNFVPLTPPSPCKNNCLTDQEWTDLDDNKLVLEKDAGSNVEIPYRVKEATIYFKAQDLYKLFNLYKEYRREKRGFQNPLLVCVLKNFIYNYLPECCSQLWNLLAELESELKIVALQQLGNNLRMTGSPYLDKTPKFLPNAFNTIVEDINYSIKLLVAYLTYWNKWKNEPSQSIKRSIICVDSIKNPYESMYLKERYTNYYLLGIYREDSLRYDQLLRIKGLSQSYVKAIDVIEQQSAFKKIWKNTDHFFQILDKVLQALGLKDRGGVKFLSEICQQLDEKAKNDPEISTNKNLKNEIEWLLPQLQDPLNKMEVSGIVLNAIYIIRCLNLYDVLPFILQDVENCLRDADIFINNEPDNDQHLLLKKKLVRYVSLIMNPGLVLPSAVERCMQLAYTAKLNSGCISRQVGAAITDSEYHLLSIGWNQQPEGQVPCSYRDLCSLKMRWSKDDYSDFELDDNGLIQKGITDPVEKVLRQPNCPLTLQGKLPAFCFKDIYNSITGNNNQVHPRSLHAEETAFLNLGQRSATGGVLFTTSSPCELCAKKAMYEGIKKIYYIEPYAGLSFDHVLNIGPQEKRPELLLFTGAVGRAYTQLYTPLMPQKDEFEFWLGAKMDAKLWEYLRERIEAATNISESQEKGENEDGTSD